MNLRVLEENKNKLGDGKKQHLDRNGHKNQ